MKAIIALCLLGLLSNDEIGNMPVIIPVFLGFVFGLVVAKIIFDAERGKP